MFQKNRMRCVTCDGTFIPKKENSKLEKRCHACRFLGLPSLSHRSVFKIEGRRKTIEGDTIPNIKVDLGSGKREYIWYSENVVIDAYFWTLDCITDIQQKEEDGDSQLKVEREELERGVMLCIGQILTNKEVAVISMRFGLNGIAAIELPSIAKSLKISKERVRQIESSAIKKLKHPKGTRFLKPYTDQYKTTYQSDLYRSEMTSIIEEATQKRLQREKSAEEDENSHFHPKFPVNLIISLTYQ